MPGDPRFGASRDTRSHIPRRRQAGLGLRHHGSQGHEFNLTRPTATCRRDVPRPPSGSPIDGLAKAGRTSERCGQPHGMLMQGSARRGVDGASPTPRHATPDWACERRAKSESGRWWPRSAIDETVVRPSTQSGHPRSTAIGRGCPATRGFSAVTRTPLDWRLLPPPTRLLAIDGVLRVGGPHAVQITRGF